MDGHTGRYGWIGATGVQDAAEVTPGTQQAPPFVSARHLRQCCSENLHTTMCDATTFEKVPGDTDDELPLRDRTAPDDLHV